LLSCLLCGRRYQQSFSHSGKLQPKPTPCRIRTRRLRRLHPSPITRPRCRFLSANLVSSDRPLRWRFHNLARPNVECGAMPGTRHFVARQLALSERAALVSAGVVEREELAVDVWGSCALNIERTNTLALPLPWSSAAKRLVHDLVGPRRIGIAAEHRLILVRHREHRQQILERQEIPSFTAAEIASSTRWLRGMKAGLAACIAARRSTLGVRDRSGSFTPEPPRGRTNHVVPGSQPRYAVDRILASGSLSGMKK
jgi:hypothetical protein